MSFPIEQTVQTVQESIHAAALHVGREPASVTLVAVTKTVSTEPMREAHAAGVQIFGENRLQELEEKLPLLPSDITWHFIGHLQTNKVKYIAPFVQLIHAVDSFKLVKEINKQAKKHQRCINCLLQIHIAKENTKYGLNEIELNALIASDEFKALKNINISGLMGMATFTNDNEQVKKELGFLKSIFDRLQSLEISNFQLNTLSMGMSGDYKLAIAEGSTMVRIGSSIFGGRNYL